MIQISYNFSSRVHNRPLQQKIVFNSNHKRVFLIFFYVSSYSNCNHKLIFSVLKFFFHNSIMKLNRIIKVLTFYVLNALLVLILWFLRFALCILNPCKFTNKSWTLIIARSRWKFYSIAGFSFCISKKYKSGYAKP
jgi:hypothetical protein